MINNRLHFKRALHAALFVLLLSVVGMTKLQAQNITFADANVKAICVANWDTNGDGELNQAEAAVVTSLDGMFMFDDEITTFDELSFFTGLTAIGEDEFNSCTNLTSISIPNTMTFIGNYAFSDCSSLASITNYACTPPTLGSNVFDNVPSAVVVNVPCHTFAMYHVAEGWSDFSNYVEFEYGLCPIPFIDDTVKAICVAYWDTDGDGELSYAEAAAVTNLGTCFKSTAITSFDELEYFTGLTSLPNTAFYGCTSLASIALPSSVSALGNGSFYNCTNLTTMTVYAETPPTVGTNAFKNVPTNMVVHVPCETYSAFDNADDWNVFSLYDPCIIVFFDANVKALCVANWDTNGDGELSYAEAAAVTSLGYVFYYKTSISSFNELQYFTGLTSIGSSAFYGCSSLTSIEIPNSVTSIGTFAFYYCSGLTTIEIPNSVTSIGSSAFYGCSSLTSIEIPNSVTSIGSFAFSGCSGLTTIEIPNSVTFISSSAFYNCSGLTTIEIPNSVTSIGSSAFSNCRGLTTIEIPNSVTFISSSAFSGCSGLTTIEIPNSVTSIGSSAFSYCSSLTTIEIPNSVTSISDETFYNCSSLTSVEIPNSVTSIGSHAFSGCSGLTTIEIPNSVTSIDYGVFEYCSGLTTIELPNSVTSIGSYVFSNCSGLTTIEIPNSVTSIGSSAFSGCSGLTTIEIPNSVTSISSSVFEDCSGLTTIEIPNSVTSIGSYAFSDCSSLTTIEIPNSVTSIDWCAFSGCSSLASMIVLAENPPTLGINSSFCGVNKFILVYVPCGSVETYTTVNWGGFNKFVGLCGAGEITVTANPAEGGTVTGGGYYEAGATCTLTATTNEDYVFLYWTENDTIVSFNNPYSFPVGGDRDLVANFAEGETCGIVFDISLIEDGPLGGGGLVPDKGRNNYNDYFVIDYGDGNFEQFTVDETVSFSRLFATGSHITIKWISDLWIDCNFEVYYEDGDMIYQSDYIEPNFEYSFNVNCSGGNTVIQTITFSEGWNWFSTNVDITLDDLENTLLEALPGTTINIKSQTQNVKYQNGRWTGQLTALDMTQMYMISVENDCEISLEGMPIDPSGLTVTINNGANWIAFPYSESMTVTDFFGSFPMNNDQVKSQSQNAKYQGNRWAGQLNTLVPGKGYLYISNTPGSRTFTFPVGAK